MDEILLHETQKVSAAKEAPSFLEYDYDDSKIYQVGNMNLEETNIKLNDVNMRLYAKIKVHMVLIIKMMWYVYMTKK